jgi:hypothetical protein
MEKSAVHIGIVNKITSLNSQFGHSWAIELDHGTRYYLNGKSEDLADKLFEVGKKTAFTTKEKISKDKVYNIVDCVLQTF